LGAALGLVVPERSEIDDREPRITCLLVTAEKLVLVASIAVIPAERDVAVVSPAARLVREADAFLGPVLLGPVLLAGRVVAVDQFERRGRGEPIAREGEATRARCLDPRSR
jgi:hypothetical protein